MFPALGSCYLPPRGAGIMRSVAILAIVLPGWVGGRSAFAGMECGGPGDTPGRFGPFDYRDPTKDHERWLVESAHFTAFMEETALYGFTSRRATIASEAEGWGLVGGNLDYTL